uniref:G-protein coupled receptors family 1 profile domain-containing protein n=1 Tax=Syphacia muris TaxID=451379 RepID=A0A0N5AM07_9BILA
MALHFLIFPVFHWIYELADIGWIPTFTLMIYFKQCLMFTFNVVCCSVYIPLYLFMKLFNSLWCLDVSNAALRYANIRTKKFQTFSYFLYVFVVIIIVIEVKLMNKYFEYVWSAKGIKIGSRLDFIERNWPYYMGFGALLAAIGIIFTQFIISYLIFGMCFPFFIISAYVVCTCYLDKFGLLSSCTIVTSILLQLLKAAFDALKCYMWRLKVIF